MDLMGRMAVNKAFNNLSVAIGSDSARQRLAEFVELRHAIAMADSLIEVYATDRASEAMKEFHKGVVTLGEAVFAEAPYALMSSAYLESLAAFSFLDAMKRYARVLSPLFLQGTTASGYVADEVTEGAPKATKSPALGSILAPLKKIASIVVWSDLLDRVPEVKALIARLSDDAITRGQNVATFGVLLANSPLPVAASTTSNARTDLEALIAALPGGRGLVVATSWAAARRLALSADRGPAYTAAGGEFLDGLHIVPTADLPAGVTMIAVEADRVAIADGGLRMRPGRHATVDLADAPTTPDATTIETSLWQHNLRALVMERTFQLACPEDAVAVVTE